MLEGSILQKLEAAHRDTKQPLNLGVYYKNTLVALCHALEDYILASESSPLMITAFQQGKWYLQEAERYGEIAQKAASIVIMAAPDTAWADHPTSQKENVSLVSLNPDDAVAQEWHLIILSPTYSAMVLCQELSLEDYGIQGQPQEDVERKFYGFWTFDPELVWETVELAVAHIGDYNASLQQQMSTQLQEMKAQFGTQPREDLGFVVSQVVNYLETSHHHLSQSDVNDSYLPSHQALDDNLLSNEMQAFLRMAQLIDQADVNNPMAAAEVSALSEGMGQLLDLQAWQIKRLRLASILHRLVPSLGSSSTLEEAPSCPLVPSVQALRAMPRMRAIAQIITHQTEHWDGSGIPGELAYDAIPLESRILALLAYFQERVNDLRMYSANPPNRLEALSQALKECQEKAGQIFDPKLVEILAILVMGMQQGMDIQATLPKIASGIWLLHPQDESLETYSTRY